MQKIIPLSGDKRIIKRFLLSPLIVGGEKRWLEYVKIEQIYSDSKKEWICIKFVE